MIYCFTTPIAQAEDRIHGLICEGNVFLSTQAEVNAFTCTEVSGNLIIQGENISDLSALSVLVRVNGGVFINENNSLKNLKGLENLVFARTLVIFGNKNLEDISAISQIGLSFDIDVLENALTVSANPKLSQCCILEQIPTRGSKSIGQNAPGRNSLEEIQVRCDSSNRILGFMLVNAETDEDIGLLEKGAILDFEEFGDIPLSIRVLTEGTHIGVVSVGVSGPLNIFRFERELPYTLLGDGVNGAYRGVLFPSGYYILTATLYQDNTLTNTVAEPLTIFFSVSAPNPQIQGFTLVNAVTNQDVQEIEDGTVIDLSLLGDSLLNIRANTSPVQIGSVVFELDGPIRHRQTENIFPYALFGNDPFRLNLYKGRLLPPGRYTLSATPYEKVFAQGEVGETVVISFEVIATNPESQTALDIFPNPSEGNLTVRTQGEASSLVIYNMQGEKIAQKLDLGETDWALQLHPGVYIIEKVSGNQVTRKKVLVR